MASETARIFNATIAAAAISALDEIGLLDRLHAEETLDVDALCRDQGWHRQTVGALLRTLHGFQIVDWSDGEGELRKGSGFAEAFKEKGYFLWLVRGYGDMLKNLASIVPESNRVGDYAGRDGKYIAMAGGDYNAQFVDADLEAMLDEQPFVVGADLGCGSGKRLIGFAKTRPGFRGVGVEFNQGGVQLARETIAAEKLDDRLQVVHGDVKRLEPCDAFTDVEVIFCFWMGHDLWPRANCIEALNGIHRAFPNAERFILADTYRSDLADASQCPTFTLGFEVTHAAMGQYVPSFSEWKELFAETDWTLHGHRDVGIPYSSMFDLRRR